MLLSENNSTISSASSELSLNPYSVGCYSPRGGSSRRDKRRRVLILILLDVTLRGLDFFVETRKRSKVLILILLDVTLRDMSPLVRHSMRNCLNPYSVGCYSPSDKEMFMADLINYVLILILLDVTLRVFNIKSYERTRSVLILILLDVTLRDFKHY